MGLYKGWFPFILFPAGLKVTNAVYEKYTSLEKIDRSILIPIDPVSQWVKFLTIHRERVVGTPLSGYCLSLGQSGSPNRPRPRLSRWWWSWEPHTRPKPLHAVISNGWNEEAY